MAANAAANAANVKALEARLGEAASGGERLAALTELARQVAPGEPRRGLELAEEAVGLARANRDEAGLARALRTRGLARHYLADYAGVLESEIEALGLWRRLGDSAGEAASLVSVGLAHYHLGELPEALERLESGLRLARENGNRPIETRALHQIALVYAERGDFERALECHGQNLALCQADGNDLGAAYVLCAMGQVGLALGRRGEALTATSRLQEALAIARRRGEGYLEVYALANLGKAQVELGHTTEGRRSEAAALDLARARGDRRAEAGCLVALADLDAAAGDTAAAQRGLEAALALREAAGAREEIAKTHEALSNLLERAGEPAAALAHHKRYHALQAELRAETTERRFQAAAARLELERSRLEAELGRRRAADLERLVAERTAALEASQLEALQRLAAAAEFRDADTGAHISRVGEVAAEIALAMGLDAEYADGLRLAARLHDLGKIGIPDAILLKPGPLSPAEWAVMREHTTIGGRMLSGAVSPLLQMAERVALSHHERWDGKGYPRGLPGELIPLEGRIAAVADAYDALTSGRPYKPAWSEAEAVAEIEREAGGHFDPVVVRAFLASRRG